MYARIKSFVTTLWLKVLYGTRTVYRPHPDLPGYFLGFSAYIWEGIDRGHYTVKTYQDL